MPEPYGGTSDDYTLTNNRLSARCIENDKINYGQAIAARIRRPHPKQRRASAVGILLRLPKSLR